MQSTPHEHERDAEFDREYDRLSARCMPRFSAERERVKAEWIAAERPTDAIEAFIRARVSGIAGHVHHH